VTNQWRFIVVNELEKVFPDTEPAPARDGVLRTAFRGETVSAQIAFRAPDDVEKADGEVRFEVLEAETGGEGGAAGARVRLFSVDLVPCELVAYPGHDDGYLRDTPGLYPDLLRPAHDGVVAPIVGAWRSAWVDVTVPTDASGQFIVTLRGVHVKTGKELGRWEFGFEIVPAELPPLELLNTHWIHVDGLATFYGVDLYGDEHWRAIEATIASAARMGVNSVLTPVWTPPVDTEIGNRRRDVQLIGIERTVDGFSFDFTRLDRWLEMCRRHAMRGIEVPHFFTQWGAHATPSFVERTPEGELRPMFGWETLATAPEYRAFLEQLIPALRGHLAVAWDGEVVYHVSDEPTAKDLENYHAARSVVHDLLDGCLVVDALSDVEFYAAGVVARPVVATDHLEKFLDAGLTDPWVYFCVTQHRDVSNRFIGMPSSRLRVLGRQLYGVGASAFLHWGFNFYGSALSKRFVDPFTDASGAGTFPAGDPFVVYPGPGFEMLESIRHRVSRQAVDDHRALQLLAALSSQEEARAISDPDGTLTFSRFPIDSQASIDARSRIDADIAAKLDSFPSASS
jgi:hypothetical protein